MLPKWCASLRQPARMRWQGHDHHDGAGVGTAVGVATLGSRPPGGGHYFPPWEVGYPGGRAPEAKKSLDVPEETMKRKAGPWAPDVMTEELGPENDGGAL